MLWRDFCLYLRFAVDRSVEDERAAAETDTPFQPNPDLGKLPRNVHDLPVLAGT